MNRPKTTYRISLAAVTVAISASMSAHAETRCGTLEQLPNEETRACELARRDTPDALIHFVNRTKGTYNLYVDDYVSKADVEGWELAKQKATPDSPAIANANGDTKSVSKG